MSSATHAVRIEKVIAGGKGLARTEAGQVLMSGLVLPGEAVRLRERSRKSGYLEADLAQVLEPSPERIQPLCPQYGHCGGCDLQHGTYAEQLRIKQAIVRESALRAGLRLPEAGVRDTIPSPQPWGYRHRLRLKISPAGQLGFFRKRSHAFAAVNSCPAAADEINAALTQLAAAGCLREFAGQEAELHLSPADRRLILVLPLQGGRRMPAAALQTLAACTRISCIGSINEDGFRHLYSRNAAAEPLTQHIPLPGLPQGCTLSWSGGCFSQVNPGQNVQLIRLVLALADDLRGKTVLDLYCGMGNFSVPLALAGGDVFGIEGGLESVRWARRNAETAKVKARFLAADVHASLRQMVKARQQADLVLLDPPRAGVGKTAALLPELRPEKIISISCDPVTLARDLAILCSKGFRLTELIPLDMFPQTSHIETAAVLVQEAGQIR